MRKILATTALAALLAVQPILSAPAYAAGLPMFQSGIQGHKAMEQMLRNLRASLAENSSGNAEIKGGSCGYTLRQFYIDFGKVHTDLGYNDKPSKKDLENFIVYLGTLELTQLTEGGDFVNSRRMQSSNGCTSDITWSRLLPKGQWVWVDRNTGDERLKGNCGNIIRRKTRPGCKYVNFEVRLPEEGQVHYTYAEPDDECLGFRKVSNWFEADTPGAVWKKPAVGCIGKPCTFASANAYAGQTSKRVGTEPLTPGIYQFRVKVTLGICVEYVKEGYVRQSTFTAYARPEQDFVLNQARVYYVSSEMPADIRRSGPRGLFLWASSQQEVDEIRREFASAPSASGR